MLFPPNVRSVADKRVSNRFPEPGGGGSESPAGSSVLYPAVFASRAVTAGDGPFVASGLPPGR
ncbi:MAG: hypothetical protein ACI9YT_002208, partial [Halobacteriales archaeon]